MQMAPTMITNEVLRDFAFLLSSFFLILLALSLAKRHASYPRRKNCQK